MSLLREGSIGLLAAALLQAPTASLLPAPGTALSAGSFAPAWLARPADATAAEAAPLRAEQAVPPFAMFLVAALAADDGADLPSPRPSR